MSGHLLLLDTGGSLGLATDSDQAVGDQPGKEMRQDVERTAMICGRVCELCLFKRAERLDRRVGWQAGRELVVAVLMLSLSARLRSRS